jgi:hypothetical protein
MTGCVGSTTGLGSVARLVPAGLVALAMSLCVQAPAVAAGDEAGPGADFRVSPDNRPGAYRRLDGTRDAVHDACSGRRRQQVEPTIAVNPRDPRMIAAGAMDACIAIRNPGPVAQAQHALAYYRSADSGRTWRASLFPGYGVEDSGPASELACAMQGDPSMAFDRHGRLFYAALCPVFVGFGTTDFQIAVATFDRDGSRFVRAVRADPTPPPDQESMRSTDKVNLAVDTTRSRHAGNVYVSYLECAGPATMGPCANENESVIHVVRSTDHGRTFSEPAVIAGPEGRFASFTDLAVGPDGTVYVTFRSSPTAEQRPIWIARSTDGGRTFSPAQLIARFTTFDYEQFQLAGGDAFGNCGDGPFTCASGFNLPVFRSFAQVTADRTGVHVAWNQERPSGQSKLFVRSSPDGVTWTSPPVQVDDVPQGHQWWPDIVSVDGVITVVFLDSRRDPAYSPDRPPGNTAHGTNPGPSVDTYVASSRDGGRTWKTRRLSRRPSVPNYETYHEARVPWYGDYIYLSGAPGAGVVAAWVDSRDVLPGDDTRPDSEENGFDVFAPCAWDPNTVTGPPTGYRAPTYSDPCLDQGGLDLNIYGAWVSRSHSCRGWWCDTESRASPGGPRSLASRPDGSMGSARAAHHEPAAASWETTRVRTRSGPALQ